LEGCPKGGVVSRKGSGEVTTPPPAGGTPPRRGIVVQGGLMPSLGFGVGFGEEGAAEGVYFCGAILDAVCDLDVFCVAESAGFIVGAV